MRIVYDDEQLEKFVSIVKSIISQAFATKAQMSPVMKWSYGMDRVEVPLVKNCLNRSFKAYGFEVGNDVYHVNGIGNNKRYPVYYNTPNEKQQIGYLNLINDMYGSVYVYVTDYNQNKRGRSYKLTRLGFSVS